MYNQLINRSNICRRVRYASCVWVLVVVIHTFCMHLKKQNEENLCEKSGDLCDDISKKCYESFLNISHLKE